jgi:hypothetical protein
MVAMT